MALTKEQIAALLSIKTLQSGSSWNIKEHQQKIDNQGRLQTGISGDERIVTYKNDLFANPEDFENILTGQITQEDLDELTSGLGAQNTIQNLITNGLLSEPDNVSQFMNFESGSQAIDPVKLHEFLSTKIYELLPTQQGRQLQVDQFVKTFGTMIPPEPPPYCTNADQPDTIPEGVFKLDIEGECNDGFRYGDWLLKYDISFIQDFGISDDNAYLTRVQGNINQPGYGENPENEYGSGNLNKSIQYIRDTLNEYLKDIDTAPTDEVLDGRPEYTFSSQGYLEVRNLNQAVVVKKGEGEDVGIGKMITLEAGVIPPGYDRDGPAIWADILGYDMLGYIEGMQIPEYLIKGFTLTQWIKFKDKVNGGTLVNFGNPLRETNPTGFRLETFSINKDEHENPDDTMFFVNDDQERFVRLVLREGDGNIRDSHFGITLNNGAALDRIDTFTNGVGDVNPLQYTHLPSVMDEWYFIVATYNPELDEEEVEGYSTYLNDFYYWNNNVDPSSGDIVARSDYGSRCRVEVISQTDLLRARGYQPIEDS